jgi:hypothetical protein
MLREVAELGVRVALALAGARRELPAEHAQQRSLAGAVRADDRHLVLARDLDAGAREHVARLVAEGSIAQPHQGAPGVRRARELKADALGPMRQDHALLLEARDHLALALGLRRLGVLGAEALDEARQLGDALLDLHVAGLDPLAAQLALLQVLREAHRVFGERAEVQLAHLGRHPVEEHAVVRDHDQPAVEVLEIVLEPLHRRQVEVVGGLVEEQQRGIGEQQCGERSPHAPPARELGERPVLVAPREAEPGEHAARLGLERVLVCEFEVVLQLARALEQRFEVRVVCADVRELRVERVQLLAHREQLAVRLHGAAEHGALEGLGRLLRQVAEPRATREHPRARIGAQLAQHHAQQRGLAGAVGPDERDAISRAQHPAEPVEQYALPDGIAQVLELDHGSV